MRIGAIIESVIFQEIDRVCTKNANIKYPAMKYEITVAIAAPIPP